MRIASFQSQQIALLNLQRAQGREAMYGQQVASGRLGDDLKAYGAAAEGVTALKSVAARTAGWLEQADRAAGRLDVQDLQLGRVQDAAAQARQAVLGAIGMGSSVGLMDSLQAAFGQAAQALNAEHEGRPLFSGARQEAPFAATTLADLTAAPDVAALFRNDQIRSSVRLGEQLSVETGVLADEIGAPFAAALRELQAFVETNGPFGTPLTEPQIAALQTLAGQLGAVETGVVELQARNGLAQSRVAAEADALGARAVSLEGLLAGRTDADPAEAVTRLQQAQIAVQASAQVYAALRGSSLLDLIG